MKIGRAFALVTGAGLIGLAVLHADAIATIAGKASGTFASALNLTGRGTA